MDTRIQLDRRNNFVTFIYLKSRMTEEGLLSICLVLKCLQQPGLGQIDARSQEFCLGLPHGLQEPKYVDHQLWLPRYISSRKLDQKRRQDLMPCTPKWDVCISRFGFTTATQYPTPRGITSIVL